MKTSVVFIVVFLMLGGCSTAPIMLRDTTRVSTAQVHQYATPTQGTGHIIVYRDARTVGGACAPDIYINGQDVADSLGAGDRVDLFPPAGTFILSLHCLALCWVTSPELAVTLAQNQVQAFEMGYRHRSVLFIPAHGN